MTEAASALPKVIWQLWLQGWDQTPMAVTASRKSWINRNPGWEVRSLTLDTLRDWLDEETCTRLLSTKMPRPALSDLIRLELLTRYGGVWADATTLCIRPLDDWLPQRMDAGFFAFKFIKGDKPLASWFLASVPNGLIVRRWREAAEAYWDGREKRDEYYWVHFLMRELIDTKPEIAEAWDQMPTLPAWHPYHFFPKHKMLFRWPNRTLRQALKTTDVPVAKMTHKIKRRIWPWTYYAYLCRTLSKPQPR